MDKKEEIRFRNCKGEKFKVCEKEFMKWWQSNEEHLPSDEPITFDAWHEGWLRCLQINEGGGERIG